MRYYFLFLLPLTRFAAAQAPIPQPLPHTVLVRGTAEQELEPEKLDLLITYRFSDNVKENGRNQEQEQALQQVLKQAGIAPEKLVLEDLSASGYGGLSKVNNATVALTKTYRLTLERPQLLNTLLPQLVQAGADNVHLVHLQNTRLETVKAELITQAVSNARQKATVAAKATGQQLGAVLSLVEVIPDSPRPEWLQSRYKLMSLAGVSSQGTTAEDERPTLRKINVKAVYDLVFEIK
ncbi:SIMPL domain-containing protein [Hymenobacter sp. M29]|uniref:SIMPL domain-containing protein n=1 Tax=Hymenobacter mellowenesis TaxID=3063995 RepID=A0ABT9ABC3_9BACT|nr:SIMPL domain-containing protein [Hymenobacter sp. M29]MDO7846843.1 SIMPL domain-containing protein [Hymenobacter sp. M29]